jgi:uncharacterized protein YbjT (DUF2867 family)
MGSTPPGQPILVTGATGHVGSELVAALLAAGGRVRVLTRDPSRVAHLAGRVETAIADLDRPETLAGAVRGVEAMYLLEADHGVGQTRNAVEAARAAGVRHVVQLSSIGARLASDTAMGRAFRARERLLQESGLAWTILRPGFFMSNALSWADSIRADRRVEHSNGEGRSAPVDPRDIAAVAAIALTAPGHEGQTYELTGPDLLSTSDQVDILSKILGIPIECVDRPVAEAAAALRAAGVPPDRVEALAELWTGTRNGGVTLLTPTVEEVTGRPPRTFESWCRDHAGAFR